MGSFPLHPFPLLSFYINIKYASFTWKRKHEFIWRKMRYKNKSAFLCVFLWMLPIYNYKNMQISGQKRKKNWVPFFGLFINFEILVIAILVAHIKTYKILHKNVLSVFQYLFVFPSVPEVKLLRTWLSSIYHMDF